MMSKKNQLSNVENCFDFNSDTDDSEIEETKGIVDVEEEPPLFTSLIRKVSWGKQHSTELPNSTKKAVTVLVTDEISENIEGTLLVPYPSEKIESEGNALKDIINKSREINDQIKNRKIKRDETNELNDFGFNSDKEDEINIVHEIIDSDEDSPLLRSSRSEKNFSNGLLNIGKRTARVTNEVRETEVRTLPISSSPSNRAGSKKNVSKKVHLKDTSKNQKKNFNCDTGNMYSATDKIEDVGDKTEPVPSQRIEFKNHVPRYKSLKDFLKAQKGYSKFYRNNEHITADNYEEALAGPSLSTNFGSKKLTSTKLNFKDPPENKKKKSKFNEDNRNNFISEISVHIAKDTSSAKRIESYNCVSTKTSFKDVSKEQKNNSRFDEDNNKDEIALVSVLSTTSQTQKRTPSNSRDKKRISNTQEDLEFDIMRAQGDMNEEKSLFTSLSKIIMTENSFSDLQSLDACSNTQKKRLEFNESVDILADKTLCDISVISPLFTSLSSRSEKNVPDGTSSKHCSNDLNINLNVFKNNEMKIDQTCDATESFFSSSPAFTTQSKGNSFRGLDASRQTINFSEQSKYNLSNAFGFSSAESANDEEKSTCTLVLTPVQTRTRPKRTKLQKLTSLEKIEKTTKPIEGINEINNEAHLNDKDESLHVFARTTIRTRTQSKITLTKLQNYKSPKFKGTSKLNRYTRENTTITTDNKISRIDFTQERRETIETKTDLPKRKRFVKKKPKNNIKHAFGFDDSDKSSEEDIENSTFLKTRSRPKAALERSSKRLGKSIKTRSDSKQIRKATAVRERNQTKFKLTKPNEYNTDFFQADTDCYTLSETDLINSSTIPEKSTETGLILMEIKETSKRNQTVKSKMVQSNEYNTDFYDADTDTLEKSKKNSLIFINSIETSKRQKNVDFKSPDLSKISFVCTKNSNMVSNIKIQETNGKKTINVQQNAFGFDDIDEEVENREIPNDIITSVKQKHENKSKAQLTNFDCDINIKNNKHTVPSTNSIVFNKTSIESKTSNGKKSTKNQIESKTNSSNYSLKNAFGFDSETDGDEIIHEQSNSNTTIMDQHAEVVSQNKRFFKFNIDNFGSLDTQSQSNTIISEQNSNLEKTKEKSSEYTIANAFGFDDDDSDLFSVETPKRKTNNFPQNKNTSEISGTNTEYETQNDFDKDINETNKIVMSPVPSLTSSVEMTSYKSRNFKVHKSMNTKRNNVFESRETQQKKMEFSSGLSKAIVNYSNMTQSSTKNMKIFNIDNAFGFDSETNVSDIEDTSVIISSPQNNANLKGRMNTSRQSATNQNVIAQTNSAYEKAHQTGKTSDFNIQNAFGFDESITPIKSENTDNVTTVAQSPRTSTPISLEPLNNTTKPLCTTKPNEIETFAYVDTNRSENISTPITPKIGSKTVVNKSRATNEEQTSLSQISMEKLNQNNLHNLKQQHTELIRAYKIPINEGNMKDNLRNVQNTDQRFVKDSQMSNTHANEDITSVSSNCYSEKSDQISTRISKTHFDKNSKQIAREADLEKMGQNNIPKLDQRPPEIAKLNKMPSNKKNITPILTKMQHSNKILKKSTKDLNILEKIKKRRPSNIIHSLTKSILTNNTFTDIDNTLSTINEVDCESKETSKSFQTFSNHSTSVLVENDQDMTNKIIRNIDAEVLKTQKKDIKKPVSNFTLIQKQRKNISIDLNQNTRGPFVTISNHTNSLYVENRSVNSQNRLETLTDKSRNTIKDDTSTSSWYLDNSKFTDDPSISASFDSSISSSPSHIKSKKRKLIETRQRIVTEQTINEINNNSETGIELFADEEERNKSKRKRTKTSSTLITYKPRSVKTQKEGRAFRKWIEETNREHALVDAFVLKVEISNETEKESPIKEPISWLWRRI